MKKNMFKSVHKLFAAAACMSMLLAGFVGCGNPMGGGIKKSAEQKLTEKEKTQSQKLAEKATEQTQGSSGNGNTFIANSAAKKITEFKFEKANNPGLTEDVRGTIDELSKTIEVIVPNGTDVKKLKASFSLSPSASASVKGTAQESGKTENDFTRLVSYTVTAENDSTEVYLVRVEAAPAAGKFSGKKILTFDFRKDINPGLSKDVIGIVGTNQAQTRGFCFIKLPVGTTEATVKALKPTFIASAKAMLSINGMKLESSKTAADFYNLQNGTNITVTAEDGTFSVYNVAVEIDLPTASEDEVKKYFGSYYAEVNTLAFGKAKIVVVLEKSKVTMYSTAMSMDYINVEWEKKDDGSYTCTTYKKGKPQIKNLYGKGGYDFTEKDGKIMVKTNIMGAPVTLTKGADFTWTKESGYLPVQRHI